MSEAAISANLASTNYLLQILTNIKFAGLTIEAWSLETWISHGRRNKLRGIAQRLNFALKEAMTFAKPADQQTLINEVLDDEKVAQAATIQFFVLAVPKEKRDLIEEYVTKIYNETFNEEKS